MRSICAVALPRPFLFFQNDHPPRASQDHSPGVDGFVDKHAGQGGEMVGILGREILARTTAAAVMLNLRMALQVVGKAVGDNGTLLDDIHALGHVLIDFINEQGVMCAAQDDRVNIGALAQQQVDILLDKIVGAVTLALAVLDQWHPHRAGVAVYLEVGIHPLNLNVIAAAGNRARRAKHTDVTRVRQFANLLHRWAHHA